VSPGPDPQDRPLVAARWSARRVVRQRPRAGYPRPGANTTELTYRDAGPAHPLPPPPKTPRWEQRRSDREEALTEHLGALNQIVESLGGLLTLARTAPSSDVLFAGTRVIGANGFDTLRLGVSCSALTVSNFTDQALTVTQDGATGSGTPTQGAGVIVIPAGVERTFVLRGQTVTTYGPAAAAFGLQAFARPRDPSAGTAAAVYAPAAGVLLALANPAPGADFSFNPSPNAPWQPISLFAQLVTSATVANRLVALRLATPAPVTFFEGFVPVAIPASETLQLSAGPGLTTSDVVVGTQTDATVGLPGGWYPAGTTLSSSTLNLQAGDQWSLLALMYAVQT
jgi:hypothetical protein